MKNNDNEYDLQQKVSEWMLFNSNPGDDATLLAETAVDVLDLPQAWLDDETHWIWEAALSAVSE